MVELPAIPMPTVEAIYRAYEDDQETGFRYHLGASLIGTECERSLWYSFRWATRARFAGRMLRLFQTGHLSEARFVADLRRIGVEIHEFAEDGKQIGVRDEFGHFGGSLDGMAIGFTEAPKTWHVTEFKTHGDKSFVKLQREGVQKSKPRHYAQMQVYMHLIGVTRAFYMAVNKNTDELYQERVEYDIEFASRLMARADRVVKSPRPPARHYHSADFFECKFCNHRDVCWGDAMPERHCRSCIRSTPIEGGAWSCWVGREMTRDRQELGCAEHLYIPDLVHGTQTDAGDDWIKYTMPDGTEWTDGVESQ